MSRKSTANFRTPCISLRCKTYLCIILPRTSPCMRLKKYSRLRFSIWSSVWFCYLPGTDTCFTCLMNLNLNTLIVYIPLCAAEYWELRKADRKYLESTWTDRVRNEELFDRVKEERSILQTTKRKKIKGIGHILRRNRLSKHVIEGKIEVKGGRGRRRKQLLDHVKETRE